jgi:ketosteroid isomerase-like protein
VTNFPDMLVRFAAAVEANDGAGLAALFTDDGVYEDGFFGAFTGPAAIAKMLAHFHETAEDFRWELFDPVADAHAGYAHYRFSYRSRMPGAEGRPVASRASPTSHCMRERSRVIARCSIAALRSRSRALRPSASSAWSRRPRRGRTRRRSFVPTCSG